jgi:hypothetical protein
VLNEPVDPATVNDGSFIVTGPDGDQITAGTNGGSADARLTALGRYIVFDPIEDFEPGDYTIEYTDEITSVFGNTLNGGTKNRTVLSVGDQTTDQFLVIEEEASNTDVGALPEDFLGGGKTNNVNIVSQLIGSNDQPVIGPEDVDTTTPPIRNRVKTTLATPGLPGFDDVFPAVIRAGQKFQLTKLELDLGGGIETPIISGPIDVNFPNDVDVYLQSNDYRTFETPTAVRLRLDLSIGTLITAALDPANPKPFVIQQLANGVFNQSVLNIQAAGLAIPLDNGDLKISTLGTFPINVNRTDDATVDFGLTLVLPADPADGEGGSGTEDSIAPFVTAQSPSACLYVFGSPLYDTIYNQRDAAPTALPEPSCRQLLGGEAQMGGRPVPPFIDSYPIESSPAVTFSSPLDPTTVNDQNVKLFAAAADGTTPTGNALDTTLRVEGFSVVIDPVGLLEQDQPYVIQLGGGLADLAGKNIGFDNLAGPGSDITFRTEPQVAPQDPEDAAPALLGTLTPGIPCALNQDGDFRTGGGEAGNCVNSSQDNAPFDYPVFTSPVDVPVDGVFSKFVDPSTVVLANGCLTDGSGNPNTQADASVALQEMDGSGQCVGTPEAELAFANTNAEANDGQTRAFTIRPVEALKDTTRYWIVVCGTDADECTAGNTATVTDVDGLALNTNPIAETGTGSTANSPNAGAQGGPDIVMPFDTIDANKDYYTNQFTLPETDTNGNGQFDDADGDGEYQPGDERPQPGNRSLVQLQLGGGDIENSNRDDGKFPSYLALTRPIALREITNACDRVDEVTLQDGTKAAGATPETCIPASLLPGGFNSLTSIDIPAGAALDGLVDNVLGPLQDADQTGPVEDIPILGPVLGGVGDIVGSVGDTVGGVLGIVTGVIDDLEALAPGDSAFTTGRIILRFPNDDAESAMRPTQTGYIVEKCTGTFPNGGPTYDYEPCFAASLTLVANAPDGQGVALEQQEFVANIVGPVTFEQNGRLVISVRNANEIELEAEALGALPATATIAPGDLNFQLVGNATHGGRAFPNR